MSAIIFYTETHYFLKIVLKCQFIEKTWKTKKDRNHINLENYVRVLR